MQVRFGKVEGCKAFLIWIILLECTTIAMTLGEVEGGGGRVESNFADKRMELMRALRERQQQRALQGGAEGVGELSHKQAKALFEAMKKMYPDLASSPRPERRTQQKTPIQTPEHEPRGAKQTRLPHGPSMEEIKARPRKPGDPTSFDMLMKKITEREDELKHIKSSSSSLSDSSSSSSSLSSSSSSSSSSETPLSPSSSSFAYTGGEDIGLPTASTYSSSHLRSLLAKMQRATSFTSSSPSSDSSPSFASSETSLIDEEEYCTEEEKAVGI